MKTNKMKTKIRKTINPGWRPEGEPASWVERTLQLRVTVPKIH